MLNNLKNFYSKKKILVTGDTGFCGSWLTLFLNQLGSSIYGLSLYDKKKNVFHNSLKSIKNYHPYYCDLLDKNKVDKYISIIKPDLVFHLAAQPLVIDAYKDFRRTINVNLIGTFNLLESLKYLKCVKNIIVITTDKVYKENNNHLSYKEEMPLGGLDPYSSTKSMVEILCNTFRETIYEDKKLFTARGGNIIGGGDFSDNRLIPDIINRVVISNRKLILRNPEFIRPWQHVLSLCFGYILIPYVSHKNPNRIKNLNSFNFGPLNSRYYNVSEVINIFSKFWKQISGKEIKNSFRIKKNNKKFYESKILKLNSSKASKYLGWKPLLNINNTLKITSEWYWNYLYNRKNILDFSKDQINEFLKKI